MESLKASFFFKLEFERYGFKTHKLNLWLTLTFGRALKACLDVLGPEPRMAYQIRCYLDAQRLLRQTAPVYVV